MIYRFGSFELDDARGELRRDGKPVALQPKPLALLTLLIEERHRIVPTDELLDRLWADEVVTSSSLSRAVSVARSAVRDGGQTDRIGSYRRRGYRFHGEVFEVGDEAEARGRPSATAEAEGGGAPFVGRDDALDRLRSAWSRAARGLGGIALVGGPAGIGKTRLTEVFEGEVQRRGGLALRGRALEEEGEPAFWVWAQVLRALREADPESLRVPGLADTGELAALMPELGAGEPAAATRLPDEQRRFVFFDAVARTLRLAARERPLLIVFEDVHWGDPASQRLLEHLAFELGNAATLLLATTRDEPAEQNVATQRTLAALRRQEHCESVSLGGLGGAEIEALVERHAGRALPELAAQLLSHTGGVPLFVREAFRRLDEIGGFEDPTALDARTPLVQVDWMTDALSGLSPGCARLLEAAAVVGRNFSLRLVADAAGTPRPEALDLLDEAIAAGIVELDPEVPGAYRFVHGLFREAAYGRLAPGARVRLHHGVVELLERQHAADVDRVIAELAHHHHQALAVGDPERAFARATRAAERAFELCAYEQAMLHRNQALAATSHLEAADPRRRLSTLLGLGEAARLSGERKQRRDFFGEALALARSQQSHQDFAAAAIGLCDLAEWGVRDEGARSALEEAIELLENPDPELEAKILTRLGYLDVFFDRERSEERLRRAVKLARELGAAEALEEALYALHFFLGGRHGHAERIEILEELRGAASAARDPVASVIAILDVACDRLERGDSAGADELRREADATAGAPPHPRTVWHRAVYDTGLALLEGRLDEVEGRCEEARSLGRRIQHPYARGCFDSQMANLSFQRGDWNAVVEGLAPALRADQGPHQWVRATTARAQLALGERDEAERLYREVLQAGLDTIPSNLRWTASMLELAHCCADLEDTENAPQLAEFLRPIESHHAVMPMVICYGGPIAWALARLSELRGFADEAEELYQEALASVSALHARPLEARIRLSQAGLLRRQGKRSEARETLSAAAALAADFRIAWVEERATSQLAD